MLVSDIINLSAKRMDLDVDDYDQQVMILHINSGIARLNNGQIKVKDPLVIKQITITGTTAKPANFFKLLIPNGYPIIETDTTIGVLPGGPTSVTLKYSTSKPLLTNASEAIPLPDYCISEVIDYVCNHFRNDIEDDISQDVALSTSDETLLLAAKGG